MSDEVTTRAEGDGPRVVLTGGGTGGHVNPALAVAEALSALDPRTEIQYIGGDRIEARLVPEAGLAFSSIAVHGLVGGMPLKRRLRALLELACGLPLGQSLRLLRRLRPQVVIGTGGYVSGPVLLAARLLRVPSVALDGNRVPGQTSKLVSKLVDVMAVAHPEMEAFFSTRVRSSARVEVTGLPIRGEIVHTTRAEAAASLGLDAAELTLVVLGGSLGSERINRALVGALDGLAELKDLAGLQALHVTGERYVAEARHGRWATVKYHPLAYAGPEVLAAADLVVSRAGASTVAEIAARGLPAVLIPWAQASTGEQVMNAQPLEEAGGAVVILDAELTPQRVYSVLQELLRDRARRAQMADASRSVGRPEAAQRVAEIALELARGAKGAR
ncbi:MAG: undecaprenyldiphospho-muramoylpentapeptide beta-N-acetylglucosaminyltransferase [Armatimonadetes bacterium]|nr:undecaprenyldiphospho-muramoylpentapeptide beta-N-acetylglucosaminyltransferase [Armatimonadota bacterium]